MDEKKLINIEQKLNEISDELERARLSEYVEIMNNPKRMVYYNFLYGLARGLGTAIGLTFLAAVLVYTLRQIVDLPLIGEYIANLLDIIDNYR